MISYSSLRFFTQEALTNLKRAGLMTFITVSTIIVALLMMGTFMLASLNMESFMLTLQEEAMVTAFLHPDALQNEIQNLKMQITAFDEVSRIQVVTPEQAIEELFSDPEDKKLLETGISRDTNPLPVTFRIKLRSGHDLDPLLAKLKKHELIESVSYGEEAFKQFQGLSELLLISSFLVTLLLGLASMFIVYNTVKLTLFMRRDEIIIMKLVGATDWFIRWPFIIEGIIHGLAGAMISSVILAFGYKFILGRLSILIPFFDFTIGSDQLWKLAMKLLLMGIVLGISGSLLSLRDLRRFVKQSH